MGKKKLAICIGDDVYRERFVRCLMNHYKQQYEIHSFCSIEEFAGQESFDGLLLGEDDSFEKSFVEQIKVPLLWLADGEQAFEEDSFSENIFRVDKYQEVYKIMEAFERLAKESDFEYRRSKSNQGECQIIGIFSLTQPVQQIPFAVTLAEIYGEKASVLLLDLQEYSGLREAVFENAQEDVLGMEDYMTAAATEACTRGRLPGGIGHEQNWDYIYPVRNTECLAEGSNQIFGKIIELLEKEQNYEVILINFGCVFTGVFTLMEYCKDFYLLVLKGETGNWREKEFITECQKREKNDLLKRIRRFEIPSILGNCEDWRKIVQQWKWNSIGDCLRKMIWNK